MSRTLLVSISFAATLLCGSANRSALGSGWNDFDLRIEGGYRIVRANSFDIGLISPQGKTIYFPEHGGETGPVIGYVVTASHVFLKTTGQKPRDNFPGDTYVIADPSEQYILVVDRSDDDMTGPFSSDDFATEPVAEQLLNHEWIKPVNPNPDRARAGKFTFLVVTLLIFGVPVLFVAAIAVAIVVIYRSLRSSQSTQR